MTTLQTSSSSCIHNNSIKATLHAPKINSLCVSLPKIQTRNLIEELNLRKQELTPSTSGRASEEDNSNSSLVTAKLYAILETVSDRIEMHANIGEQRNNWNALLLTNINALIISAATMAGLAAIAGNETPILALKLSSTLLYSAATGMSLVMNKIQPSQLAEEQRNAVRLFKQLCVEIQTVLAIGRPTSVDMKNAMKKVLALDKAYPLPLLGGVMLDKFPKTVEPAVWWPQQEERLGKHSPGKAGSNGWSAPLENEMRRIVGVLERKDEKEYVRLSKMILNINKALAISGPLLTGMAAFGSTLVGAPSHGSGAAVFAIVCGAFASAVNTLEHGGQVGMVFEMYRSCAGSFQLLQQSIESTLQEKETLRENGQVFEMKVALQLGRSLSELRSLADVNAPEEFGSKLL